MARKPDDKFKDISGAKQTTPSSKLNLPLDNPIRQGYTALGNNEGTYTQTGNLVPSIPAAEQTPAVEPSQKSHAQLLYEAALAGGGVPGGWYHNDRSITDGTETNPINATPEPDITDTDMRIVIDDPDVYPDGPSGLGGVGIPDPVSYSSQYRAQMDAILRDLNLDKFKFDLNGEELYQQYKDQFLRNGRLAMMDTMGQAAGLTGGYGSTYAQSAGQQAYQGYVNDLNNVVPDVYNAAYTRWRDSISDKLRQYELLANQDNTDYSRWYNEQTLAEQQRKNTLAAQVDQYNAETKRQEADRKAADDEWDRVLKSGAGEYGPGGERIINSNYTQNTDGTYTRKTPVETPAEAPKSTTKIGGVLESDITDAVTAHYENYIMGKGFGRAWATLLPGWTAKQLASEVAKKNNWGAATEDAAREMFEILLSNDKQ